MNIIDIDKEYKQWINDICCRFKNSQIKASTKVNSEMLYFYWSIGEDIEVKYKSAKWGDKIIDLLSKDLQRLLPDAHCFSRTNLYYIKNQLLNRQNVQLVPKLGDNCIQLRIKQIKFFDIIEICSRKTMRIGHQTYNITNQKLFKGYYILLKSHLFFTQKLITFYSKVRFKK